MSSPFSTSSLGNAAQLRLGSQQARIGISALDGLGAQSDSFSRALENRMNTPAPAPRKPESAPPAPLPPERTASAEAPREPERPAGSGPADGESGADTGATSAARTDAGGASASGSSSSRADGANAPDDTRGAAAHEDTTQAGASGEAAAAGDAEAVAGQTGHAARLAALAAGVVADTDETPAEAASATASSPTDPAALAGLPAAIAALLAGRAESPSSADEAAADTGTLQLSADGGRKSLQNSALLPKTDLTATAGGDAGIDADATPAFLLQGREFAAAAAAARSATGAATGGMQADVLEGLGPTGTQAHGLAHTQGATQLLRPSAAAQAASPQLPVATPAGEPGWAEDVGNQVRWMLGRAESKAELVLTPPNMGKLEVSINLSGDQTTAQFIASSQAARDALERALPQLREALQQAGILLGDANVSTSGQGREGDGREGGGSRGERGEAGAGGNTGAGSASVWLKQQQGMVDTFA